LSVAVGVLAVALLLPAGAFAANGHANFHAVCPAPPARAAHCHALVVTDAHGRPDASLAPTGLSPAQIKSVYNFPTSSTAGSGKTIAIVDAYDDPTAESDLAVFSSQFGLPGCTTANGCFSKVDQNGGSNYPVADGHWALEISLDIQWAHAIAPGAKILLVEAASNNFSDLLVAEDYAKAHAQYVSNSWGSPEFLGESSFDPHFQPSGSALSVFVSAGDLGLPAEYPSSSPNVISVGGTTLHFDATGAFTDETGWSLGGGGCSAYEAPNPAQSSFAGYAQVNCNGKRATPDVALDADPNSGVSVYDSTPYNGSTGWFQVGGTSASSPMWAARSAVAGVVVNAAYVYGNSIAYRDITLGNNGASCLIGYDLCSGRGSWLDAAVPAQPSISSFGPVSGPIGTRVLIKGSGLAGTTGVSFNGTAAASFTSTSTQVVATVPAGTTTGPITVRTPGGTATTATSFNVTSTASGLAVTYQIGVDHAGIQNDAALTPPFAQRWSVDLGNTASYPVIAAGKVFVTTAQGPPGVYGTYLYALDQATGAIVWQKTITGTYSFSAAAYDNGQLFVLNYDGLLQAFDAATGTLAWANKLSQSSFTSPPAAANGVVYVGGAGSGGTVYAVDEVTGGLISSASVMNGDNSSPALANGNVYVGYACDQAYGLGQTTLSALWHYSTDCEGGGGKTVVVAGGRAYTRDQIRGNDVLDATTGALLGTWAPITSNPLLPAVDATTVYWLNPSTHVLTAQNVSDGAARWTFTGDGQLDTAPIILVGAGGEFVVEGSQSGRVYALDTNGNVAWQGTVPSIPPPDEWNADQRAGLGAGQGLLVVPAGNTVVAFAPAPAPPPPTVGSFTPTSGPVGTAVTINGSHFTGATAVRFSGTATTSFTVVNDTQITTTVPAGATTGAVSVTTAAGTGSSSGVFTVIPPPGVSSYTPTSGPVGTAVTINGSHFTGATAVRFNGTAATSFTVVNDTQITTTVPAGATTGAVSVTTAAGTGQSSGVFTVTVPDFSIDASPSSRSVVAGSSTTYTVMITPSGGFGATVALSVSGVPAGATASFSGSTLTIATGRNAKPGTSTLTITGTGGGKTHATTVSLQVTKK
jgi:outer membrane protein assembly factor BamB